MDEPEMSDLELSVALRVIDAMINLGPMLVTGMQVMAYIILDCPEIAPIVAKVMVRGQQGLEEISLVTEIKALFNDTRVSEA